MYTEGRACSRLSREIREELEVYGFKSPGADSQLQSGQEIMAEVEDAVQGKVVG